MTVPRVLLLLFSVSFLSFSLPNGMADTVFSQSNPATGQRTVAPYPGAGTNFLDWILAGSPGVYFSRFSAPDDFTLRSVKLEMADSPDPSGGFTLSLCTVESDGSTLRLGVVATLLGSDNPASAGSYIYTVPPGLNLKGSFGLIAQVAPGGGSYRWLTTSTTTPKTGSGGDVGFVVANGSVEITFGGPLDLSEVIVFATDDENLLYRVEADPPARSARLAAESPLRFAPVQVGKRGRAEKVRLTNVGTATLQSLSLRPSPAIRRHFHVGSPTERRLEPGEATALRIRSTPKRPGRISGTIKLGSTGGTATLRLNGRGIRPKRPVPQPIPSARPDSSTSF